MPDVTTHKVLYRHEADDGTRYTATQTTFSGQIVPGHPELTTFYAVTTEPPAGAAWQPTSQGFADLKELDRYLITRGPVEVTAYDAMGNAIAGKVEGLGLDPAKVDGFAVPPADADPQHI